MTSFVMFILVGSTVFSLVFRGVNGDLWVEHLLTERARRRARLPDRGERDDLPARVLPRLLRDRVHHGAAARAGGAEARHRPDLVRRAARRSTCRPRSCIRLSASRCSTCAASRRRACGHRKSTGARFRSSHPGPDGRDRHRLPDPRHEQRHRRPGAIKGTGAEELRRQIQEAEPVAPDSGRATTAPDQSGRSGAEIERVLKGRSDPVRRATCRVGCRRSSRRRIRPRGATGTARAELLPRLVDLLPRRILARLLLVELVGGLLRSLA